MSQYYEQQNALYDQAVKNGECVFVNQILEIHALCTNNEERQRNICKFMEEFISKDFVLAQIDTIRAALEAKFQELVQDCSPAFRPRIERLISALKKKYHLE